MADCCVQQSQDFTAQYQAQQQATQTQCQSSSFITIPQCPPLLYSSFIEQSSQTYLNLCLFQDQVVIAQDRLAKSTLIFDGMVKFAIFSEQNGQFVHSKIIFSKNDLSTTFLFLNSGEAQLWYMKLLELGIPQLVQVGYPTSEQQRQFSEQQAMDELLAKEQEKVKTHSKKPSIFKYESLNLPYQGVYNEFNQTNQTINRRFNKTSSQVQGFLYKLILTKNIRNVAKQDAIVLEQVLL